MDRTWNAQEEGAPRGTPPPVDLFGQAPPVDASLPYAPNRLAWRPPVRPTPTRLIVGGVSGGLIAWLFGMPFFPSTSTSFAGVPLPVGTLFAIGMIGLPGLSTRRALQQCLRAVVAALFFAYGFPMFVAPFPPELRVVFYLGMSSTVLALYEWAVPD